MKRLHDHSTNCMVRVNVGGRLFAFNKQTLLASPSGLMQRMFGADGGITVTDDSGNAFLDRDPAAFEVVAAFLRTQHALLIDKSRCPVALARAELAYFFDEPPVLVTSGMMAVEADSALSSFLVEIGAKIAADVRAPRIHNVVTAANALPVTFQSNYTPARMGRTYDNASLRDMVIDYGVWPANRRVRVRFLVSSFPRFTNTRSIMFGDAFCPISEQSVLLAHHLDALGTNSAQSASVAYTLADVGDFTAACADATSAYVFNCTRVQARDNPSSTVEDHCKVAFKTSVFVVDFEVV